jgi:hypothetical protein
MARYLGPGIAAALAHAALLFADVAAQGGDPAALVCVGRDRVGRPPYEAVHVGRKKDGYDGQYYYAIARAPWHRQSFGVDLPAVRHARILYPLMSWALSCGDTWLLPRAMAAVNLLAIGGLAAIGAAIAVRYGLSAWHGFFLPLAVDAALPALRDLGDVTSTCAICCLVAVWLWQGPSWAMTLSALAALLAREQNVAVVVLVLCGVAWRQRWWDAAGLAAALAVWCAWHAALYVAYGQWPVAAASGNVDLPGKGLQFLLDRLVRSRLNGESLTNIACLLVLAVRGAVAITLLRTPADRLTVLLALAGLALAVIGGKPVYEDKWSFMRVFAWLPLGCWLGCVQARQSTAAVAVSLIGLFLPIGVVVQAWLVPAGA